MKFLNVVDWSVCTCKLESQCNFFVNYRKTQRAKKLKLRDTQREATLEV